MNPSEKLLQDLAALNQNFHISKSKLAGILSVSKQYELRVDTAFEPEEWNAVDCSSGEFLKASDIKGSSRIIIDTFVEQYRELKTPLNNLEESGFDLSVEVPDITPVDIENSEEEEKNKTLSNIEKLEALENEDIEKPAPKTDWKKTSDKIVRTEAYQAAIEQAHSRQVVPLDIRMKQIIDLSIEDIRNFINPKATIQEAGMFLKLCQARGLNPFLGEAHLIKYNEGEAAQFVTGKEAFTRRAELNPHVKGWKAGIIVRKKETKDSPAGAIERRQGAFKLPEEELLGGWTEIHRDDSIFPFVYEVTLQEYIGRKRDGTITKMWKEKECTMIRKDAIVGGLREAAPSELGGLYDAAEMGGEAIEAVYEVVD